MFKLQLQKLRIELVFLRCIVYLLKVCLFQQF